MPKHVLFRSNAEFWMHVYTRTKKKHRVTYKDSFKGYNVILHYILKLSLYITRRFIFDLVTANKTSI